MSKVRVTYDGSQHCTALQEKKGKSVAADCPHTGKGEEFSPAELVGAGLAGCMLMSMGTLAMRDKLDISGAFIDVEVSTTVTRIGAIDLAFMMPRNFSEANHVKLKKAAWMCPIKRSFHPDVTISAHFNYP